MEGSQVLSHPLVEVGGGLDIEELSGKRAALRAALCLSGVLSWQRIRSIVLGKKDTGKYRLV